jgi:hypothetical protein
MKRIAFVAAACMLAASAFAQSSVSSSGGASVTSGTGVVVTPGVPTGSVAVNATTTGTPMPQHHLLPGGTMVQRSSTTVLGGPAPGVSGTKTVVTTYWANVPADAARDANFQRWQALK